MRARASLIRILTIQQIVEATTQSQAPRSMHQFRLRRAC